MRLDWVDVVDWLVVDWLVVDWLVVDFVGTVDSLSGFSRPPMTMTSLSGDRVARSKT